MIEIKLLVDGKEISKKLKLKDDFFQSKIWSDLTQFHDINVEKEQLEIIFQQAQVEFFTPEMIEEFKKIKS